MPKAADEKGKKPIRPSRERKLPRKRAEEVIDVAARVFYQKGYELSSIQDIADELGLLKGSVYYYIDSKEDLLSAVIERTFLGWSQSFDQVRQMTGTALEKIQYLVQSDVRTRGVPAYGSAVTLRDFRSLSEESQRKLRLASQEHNRFLRDLIEQGQAEGSIRGEVNSTLMSRAIFSLTVATHEWNMPTGPEWREEEIRSQLAGFIIGGLEGFRPGLHSMDLAESRESPGSLSPEMPTASSPTSG